MNTEQAFRGGLQRGSSRLQGAAPLRAASGAVLAVLTLLFCGACNRRAHDVAALPPPAVRAEVLKPASGAPLELRGAVQASSRLRLGFKLPGLLTSVKVKQGDQVRKGQVLAQLDPIDALGQLRAAGANRSKAARDWRQASRLSKDGAVAASVKEDARSALEIAEANLALATDAFKHTKLISPVDGKVVQRMGEPGESVGAGMPVLVVDETDSLVVRVGVTDRDLEPLAVGQPVSLELDGGEAFKGVIATLGPTPDPADGLYAVEVRPERQDLQPGALVRARFEATKEESILRIPLGALVRRKDKDWVFVIEGAGEGAMARLRPIEAGRSEGKLVVVRTGLKPGDRIVTEGAYFLQDSQPVQVLN